MSSVALFTEIRLRSQIRPQDAPRPPRSMFVSLSFLLVFLHYAFILKPRSLSLSLSQLRPQRRHLLLFLLLFLSRRSAATLPLPPLPPLPPSPATPPQLPPWIPACLADLDAPEPPGERVVRAAETEERKVNKDSLLLTVVSSRRFEVVE